MWAVGPRGVVQLILSDFISLNCACLIVEFAGFDWTRLIISCHDFICLTLPVCSSVAKFISSFYMLESVILSAHQWLNSYPHSTCLSL